MKPESALPSGAIGLKNHSLAFLQSGSGATALVGNRRVARDGSILSQGLVRTRSLPEGTVPGKGGQVGQGTAPRCRRSIRLFTNLLSGPLSRQGLLDSTLRARLQVKGVTLHFLNDVFGLNLALKPAQGILDRLAFLQSNFRQRITPQPVPNETNNSLTHLHSLRPLLSCLSTQVQAGLVLG